MVADTDTNTNNTSQTEATQTESTPETKIKDTDKTPKTESTIQENVTEEKQESVSEDVSETKPDSQEVAEKVELKSEEDVEKPFDWSRIEEYEDYSIEEKEKLLSIYSEKISTINEKDILNGTITEITPREVVVNINYKSDGIISTSELKYLEKLKVGDTIEVLVEQRENRQGQLVLSHKKARTIKSWERINEVYDTGEIIKGYVKSRTKGGLIVDIWGIDTFLPGSQIDVKPIKDYDLFVDKYMDFKVIKINKEFNNIVVSHKVLVEEGLESQRQEIIHNLEKGQVLEGEVKNITDYGVFIDLGGVDGLIHITDLSWGRVKHPSEIVEMDQKLNVVVLDFDYAENKKRIALGLKQLQDHPWKGLDTRLKVGDIVEGTVVVVADYGLFLEIEHGIEGLLHISEMSWSQYTETMQDKMKVGEKIKVLVQSLEYEDRKMSLSLKRLTEDPWKNITTKYPINSKHNGKVINYTNYGVFIELEHGIEGLVYISDLSWLKKVKHPSEVVKIGNDIDVIVLAIDEENRKLSLSHKHIEEDPWKELEETFQEGSIHKGMVTELNDKGAIILLSYGLEGFAPKKHLYDTDGNLLKNETEYEFKVIELNSASKKLILSHTQIVVDAKRREESKEKKEKSKERIETQRNVRNIKKNVEKTTLGDLTALSNIKSDIFEQQSKTQKETPKTTKKAVKTTEKASSKTETVEKEEVKKTVAKKTTTKKKEATDDKSDTVEKKTKKVTPKKATAKKEKTDEEGEKSTKKDTTKG